MKTHSIKPHRVFWSILILGGGVLLLLSALGIGVESDPYKIIGSILLLGIAVSSAVKLRFFFTLVPLAGVAYLWRAMLGYPNVDLWTLLGAAALLGIGLAVLFHRKPDFSGFRHGDYRPDVAKSATEETVDANESVAIECTFGEQTKYIHADNLKRVALSCNFAQVKIYFDQCKVDSEGLTIHISGSFCGIEDQGQDAAVNEAKVHLVGSLNFGEIKIVRV